MFSNYNSNKLPILDVPVFVYMICLLTESTTTETSPVDSESTPCGTPTGLWSQSAQLSPMPHACLSECHSWGTCQEQTSDHELNKLIADLSQFLEGPALEKFVVSQIHAAKCKRQGQRWTPQNKSSALAIYHSRPRTYTLLWKVIFSLSISTRKRNIRNRQIQSGVTEQLMDLFKNKVGAMSEQSKLCAVVFDKNVFERECQL